MIATHYPINTKVNSLRSPKTRLILSASLGSLLIALNSHATLSKPLIKDKLIVANQFTHSNEITLPFTTTQIDAFSPENQLATSVADLLRSVPGVEVTGSARSNGQNIAMRGYNQKGVVIMVDGVRAGILTDFLGSYFIDPALIKSISVVKGANSTHYGSNALGGVIAFKTVNATDLLTANTSGGWRIIGSTATMNNSHATGLSAFGKTEQLDGLLSINYRRNNHIRLSDDSTIDNQDKIQSFLAKGTWILNDEASLSAIARFYHNDAIQANHFPNTYAMHNLAERITQNKDYQLTYQINPQNYQWINTEITLHRSETDIKTHPYPTPRMKIPNNTIQSYEIKGIKLSNQHKIMANSVTPITLNYGAEYLAQSQTTNGKVSGVPEGTIEQNTLWLLNNLDMTFIPVSVSSGIRYTHYKSQNATIPSIESINTYWSPHAAITYRPTDWLTLFSSYNRAFRTPTIEEQFQDELRAYGKFLPNPDLKPETAKSAEIGVALSFDSLLTHQDQINVKVSGFKTRSQDFIDLNITPISRRYSHIQYINKANVKIWGVDATAEYTAPYFNLRVGFNQTYGKNQLTNDWLTTFGPKKLFTQVNIPIAHDITLGWDATFAGAFKKQNGIRKTFDNSADQGGYSIHNFYVTWQPVHAHGVMIGAGIDNLFAKQYYSPLGILQTGRNIKLQASYQW